MAVRTGPTNYQLQILLQELDVQARNSPFWRKVADDLRKPARQRRVVNIYRIEKAALEGETVLVPGKVLSVGELNKKLSVAALTFSKNASLPRLCFQGSIPRMVRRTKRSDKRGNFALVRG